MTKKLQSYRKKSDQFVVAVQLDLETDGLSYRKWGAEQKCKKGDWLVNNNDETYTIDKDSFEQTYRKESPGLYVKSTPVLAEIAEKSGSIETKEGQSTYKKGDYIIYNNEDKTDAYCMSAENFQSMYELDN